MDRLFWALCLVASSSLAQPSSPKKIVFNYGDLLVEGEIPAPEGTLLTAQKSVDASVEAQHKRALSIEKLQKKATPSTQELHQLADLLSEQGGASRRSALLLQIQSDEAQIQKKASKAAELAKESALAQEEATRLFSEALKTYRSVLKVGGSYPKQDAVLYSMGLLYQEKKSAAEAISAYRTLVESYPSSSFLEEASLSLAELLFAQREDQEAITYYQLARQKSTPQWLGYSLSQERLLSYLWYKEAWCHLRLSQYKDAQDALTEALLLSNQSAAPNKAMKKELLRSIRLVALFSLDANEALALFERFTPPGELLEQMLALGESYTERGRPGEAVSLFELLLTKAQENSERYQYQYALCQASRRLLSLGEERFYQDLKDLLSMYRALPTKTAEAQTASFFKEAVYQVHATGYRTGAKPYLYIAKELYPLYLESFPKTEDFYQVSWNYAELLFYLAEARDDTQWEPAAQAYQRLIELDPKGKHAEEAAFAQVIVYQNLLRIKGVEQAPPKPEDTTPLPIAKEYQQLLEAYRQYALLETADPEKKLQARVEVSYIYYLHRQWEEALRGLKEVPLTPNNRASRGAALLMVDILLVRGDKEALFAYLSELAPIRAEIQYKVDEVEARLRMEKCGALFALAAWDEAGDCYKSLLEEISAFEERPLALLRAGLSLEHTAKPGRALDYQLTLLKEVPSSTPEAREAMRSVARLYAGLGMFEDAAAALELLAEAAPSSPEAPGALWQAAQYQIASDLLERAATNLGRFLLVSKGEPLAKAALLLAQVRDQQAQELKDAPALDAQAAKAYESYVAGYTKEASPDELTLAQARLAYYRAKAGKKTEAKKLCSEVVSSSLLHEATAWCALFLAEQSPPKAAAFLAPFLPTPSLLSDACLQSHPEKTCEEMLSKVVPGYASGVSEWTPPLYEPEVIVAPKPMSLVPTR